MAVLTAKQRKRVPKAKLGLPGMRDGGGEAARGGYPMPDRSHAANAKARAQQQYAAGRLPKSKRDRVFRMANKMLYGVAAVEVPEEKKGAGRKA